jgi:single-strand DNA-binding protein
MDPTICVAGNLTADPELRFTPAGVAVASFTVASTPRTFDKAANAWKDGETVFLRVAAWRQLGENVAESLHRGARVIVSGRLRQSSWTAEDGSTRTAIEVDAEEVGPSLRWATAHVTRAARTGPTQPGQPEQPGRAGGPAAGAGAGSPWDVGPVPTGVPARGAAGPAYAGRAGGYPPAGGQDGDPPF